MKAAEFNLINPTWLKIEENTKEVCKRNNVRYYDYLGSFVRYKLFDYLKAKFLIKTIKTLDFDDKIRTRAILNKRDFSNKETELRLAKEKFKKAQKELFDWLDKVKEPEFFILNEVFEYGSGISYGGKDCKRCGYKKIIYTGAQNVDILNEYREYKTK